MSTLKPLLPRLESSESTNVKSAEASISSAAGVHLKAGPLKPSRPSRDNTDDHASTKIQKVEIDGQAKGFFTSREGPPGTGTRFQVNANGTISPFGAAYVTGSFHTLESSNGGVATGTLTITGKQGKLHLVLTGLDPALDGRSTERADDINRGEVMVAGSKGTSEASAEPTISLKTFRFQINRGTGQYARDRGTGLVQIEVAPALSKPPGPPTYTSALTTTAGIGQALLTFVLA